MVNYEFWTYPRNNRSSLDRDSVTDPNLLLTLLFSITQFLSPLSIKLTEHQMVVKVRGVIQINKHNIQTITPNKRVNMPEWQLCHYKLNSSIPASDQRAMSVCGSALISSLKISKCLWSEKKSLPRACLSRWTASETRMKNRGSHFDATLYFSPRPKRHAKHGELERGTPTKNN